MPAKKNGAPQRAPFWLSVRGPDEVARDLRGTILLARRVSVAAVLALGYVYFQYTGSGVALRGLRPGQGVDVVAADISTTMLARARATAVRLGVDDQVTTVVADAGALPFGDGSFDRVVSFTGLHCFPDPHRAAAEMVRVLTPGGVVSGSTLLSDTGPRYAPLRWGGTAAGILGPMCTSRELRDWLREAGCGEVSLEVEGAVGWFRATKGDRG